MSKAVYTVELFDPEMKIYKFTYITDDVGEAVVKAMDSAFEKMPDNQFALASIKGDEDKIQEYMNRE